MKTQQVSRSRTEDMNDPRLAHLPTAEEYEMNLTRRRYGEEAIDKRARELMENAPVGRTQADAVRMAGREALNQKRRDRGMLDLDQKAERREGIRMKQQEMFEQRRDARAARRQERRDRRQLEMDARREGMTPEQLLKVRAERGAIGQEERMQQAQIDAATAEAQAGRKFEGDQADAARRFEGDQADAARRFEGDQADKTRTAAATQADADREVRREEINQRMQQGETANLIAQGELDLKTAIHEHAVATDGKPMSEQEMTAFAGTLVEAGLYTSMTEAMADVGTATTVAGRMVEERQRRTDGRESMTGVDPATGGTATPGWVQDLSKIESGVRMSESDANRQKEELADMDRSVDSIVELMGSDPNAAREQAARISQAMIEANPDIEQSEAAWFETDNTRMTAANKFAYMLFAKIASGQDIKEDLDIYKDRLRTAYKGYKPRERRGR
jgi:hypothetical protein